ncbi:MAG: type II toxin-antitoxin system PemK/MazF family toxin [Clostridiales bacterium]|nr:type II toxin-antitoxin system PemK/MazF family toxin [Clostridiales bacterium]
MEKKIKRGEIYYADLNPVIGSEQGGIRPVLVVQNDIGNNHSHTTIIITVITSKLMKKQLPTHVVIHDITGLPMKSIILCEHLRTIDRSRIVSYIGKLTPSVMREVDRALAVSLNL